MVADCLGFAGFLYSKYLPAKKGSYPCSVKKKSYCCRQLTPTARLFTAQSSLSGVIRKPDTRSGRHQPIWQIFLKSWAIHWSKPEMYPGFTQIWPQEGLGPIF